MAIRVFGLTGGIATGKSRVAERFSARGVPVIDADALARHVVAPGSPALAEVAAEFGADVIGEGGELDRKRLGLAVFADAGKRARLNAILHPRIRRAFAERVRELDQSGEPLACYQVPLLFEVGLEDTLRPIVVVATPETLQLSRLMARDGRDERSARERIAAQLPLAAKVARADHVIDNSGSLAATYEQADRVLDAIVQSLGLPGDRYAKPS